MVTKLGQATKIEKKEEEFKFPNLSNIILSVQKLRHNHLTYFKKNGPSYPLELCNHTTSCALLSL